MKSFKYLILWVAKDVEILIHEASMEDEMVDEAKEKRHRQVIISSEV